MSTQIPNEWLIGLPVGADKPHGTLDSAGMLWVGMESSPATLTRIDPANPGTAQTLVFPADGQHNWIIDLLFIPAKGKVYALFVNSLSGDRTVVSEIDPTLFPSPSSANDVINDSSSGHACAQGSFCVDSTYMYISTAIFSANAVLLKYALANWIFVGSPLTLSFDHGSGTQYLQIGHNCRYDGTSIFISSANSNLTSYLAVVRVDPVSFTVVDGSTLIVGSGADTTLTDDSAFTDDYAWYGSETTGNIVRFLKSDLSSQTQILTAIGPPNYGVYNDGTYLWSVYGTSPGTAIRVDPNTLALATFVFPSGSTPAQNATNEVLSDGTHLFFTGFTSPGWVSAANQALMDGIIATPGFSPAPASFTAPPTVTITSTPGATIRYTLDGSTPSESNGIVYAGPIVASGTLKAIAYFAGTDSAIASGDYVIVVLSGVQQEQLSGIGTSTIIPLTTAPNQTMTVNLPINGGTLTLNLSIYYNENGLNGNFWVMDIADQLGNPLVSSVPLVTGTWPAGNILAPWDYLRIGAATVLNLAGSATDIPDDSTLGSQYVLVWSPN